jgi:hypothetical protein
LREWRKLGAGEFTLKPESVRRKQGGEKKLAKKGWIKRIKKVQKTITRTIKGKPSKRERILAKARAQIQETEKARVPLSKQITHGFASAGKYISKPSTQKKLGHLAQMGHNVERQGTNIGGLLFGPSPARKPIKKSKESHEGEITIRQGGKTITIRNTPQKAKKKPEKREEPNLGNLLW